jgi:hypothetical protein
MSDRIAMIQFDKGFLKPEMEELIEEISHMCWGNINMDEREPYTWRSRESRSNGLGHIRMVYCRPIAT